MADSNAVSSSGDEEKRVGPVMFLKQVMDELRKVVWPTQQQLITYFVVVMVFVIVMVTLVSVLDLGFGKLAFWLFGGDSGAGAQ